jgi:hypothetical protein
VTKIVLWKCVFVVAFSYRVVGGDRKKKIGADIKIIDFGFAMTIQMVAVVRDHTPTRYINRGSNLIMEITDERQRNLLSE